MPQEDEMAVLSVSVFLNETFTLNLVEYHMCRVRVIFVLVMFEVPLRPLSKWDEIQGVKS